MKRIFEDIAYTGAPVQNCFWNVTAPSREFQTLGADQSCDVAIVGAGFTGISAAYHLAKNGVSVILLDAETPLFGATGRNGGFCCLGGSKASDAGLDRLFGKDERLLFRQAEKEAVGLVRGLLNTNAIDADTHSSGETQLAHRPKDSAEMAETKATILENYGVEATYHPKEELMQLGLGGPFFGALTTPLGFALNPRKYATGLLEAAIENGVKVYAHSPVIKIERNPGGYDLRTPVATLRAEKIIIATNGYSSEDLPDWMRSRFMPVQSSIILTRPLKEDELNAQGWTSDQMAYDTRKLLHYFRLLPDRRFLFGMRGGLFATQGERKMIEKEIRANFNAMFPAWSGVEIEHEWYGLLCLNRSKTPYVGAIPDMQGAFAGFGYHGNGVGMGSYAGALLADLARGVAPERPYPQAMRTVPKRFPLGPYRRHLMRPLYQWMAWQDR